MRKSILLPPGGRPCKGSGRAGNDECKNNSRLSKSNPEIPVNPIPQAIIHWPAGLDYPPQILPLGDTDVETEQIRTVLLKALKLKAPRRTERVSHER